MAFQGSHVPFGRPFGRSFEVKTAGSVWLDLRQVHGFKGFLADISADIDLDLVFVVLPLGLFSRS